MDLPDCPPGAEGYEDTVQEVIKKPGQDEEECTKAEQEFQEHLNSLKIKVEDGGTRPMVERRGRDISGKWIYLCFPCAAMCSGEAILQTHISGKKHKTKLAMKNVWPMSIFVHHPYIQSEKGKGVMSATESTLQKMAAEVNLHNKGATELEKKYSKYRDVTTHIQDVLDGVKAPLLGVEYLIEHPPEQAHYEPSYICALCQKQGHPRTIVNHMTSYWHRYTYLNRHYQKAHLLLHPYRSARDAISVIINRISQRIEDSFGRQKPCCIEKDEYEKDKEGIHQWLFKGHHFSENNGPSFEEIVDPDLIESLIHQKGGKGQDATKDPSPPVVKAPTKPLFKGYTRPAGRNERRAPSAESLSDLSISGDEAVVRRTGSVRRRPPQKDRKPYVPGRYNPYRREEEGFRSRFAIRNPPAASANKDEKQKPPNYEYKLKLVESHRKAAEDSAKKMLAYHEKNPEKHPLYPEEWKKFWNRRYKEIQGEGKDPSKHDFKPEWIVYWTTRMKELHEQELRVVVNEIYRKLCLTPPPDSRTTDKSKEKEPRRKSPEPRRRPDIRRRSPDPHRKREPEPHRRWSPGRRYPSPGRRLPSPGRRLASPGRRLPSPGRRLPSPGRRLPSPGRRLPSPGRRLPSPGRRLPSPGRRLPSPGRRQPSPDRRRPSPERRYASPERRRSPVERKIRTRSRSPISSASRASSRPAARAHIELESLARRSQSPLSKREQQLRNRSPGPVAQCVLISDDELRPDNGGASPWNSDSLDSLGSLPDAKSPIPRPRSRNSSVRSRHSVRPRDRDRERDREYAPPQDIGTPDDVVGTLRLLVALEDYLGSLGPKVVDLLTEALKMEKEKANLSEELLERDSAVAIMETAKEKLKGAVQAGLVHSSAAAALRRAVVRVAALLHEGEKKAKSKKKLESTKKPASAVPVAGVGEVDRAQIAQQMAAALIAQGKTDVSSEELAQLVDAVVGMAEAKKRVEAQKKLELEAAKPAPAPAAPSGASALQMLQSAYDEYDAKKVEKEAPDAMDGLSDSDLETLLKNFNELSAEEQHSLIAYLKKLEAKEPRRVERLREYVSDAATAKPRAHPALAPAPAPTSPPPPPPAPAPATASAPVPAPAPTPAPAPRPAAPAIIAAVTIESDDDDYTVEEVFKSVTQKVKEDQIRQEMEIVTKSLQEAKPAAPVVEEKAAPTPVIDVKSIKISSAANLLAMVQASLAKVQPTQTTADVVSSVSHTQPRSFGDLPETSADTSVVPMMEEDSYQGSDMVEDTMDAMQDQQNMLDQGNVRDMPMNNYDNVQNDNANWPMNNMGPNRGNNMGNPMSSNMANPMSNNMGNPMSSNMANPMSNNVANPMSNNMGNPMNSNLGNPMSNNMGNPMSNMGNPMSNNMGNPMSNNMGNNFRNVPMNDMGNNMRNRPGFNNYDSMQNDNMQNYDNNDNMGNMQNDMGNMQNDMGNVRNAPMNNFNQGMPMGNNQWDSNPAGMNQWDQPGSRPNPWETRPLMQQQQNRPFGNFNQGPRGGGNFNNRGGMQNDNFNHGPRGGGNFNNRGGKQNDNFNQFGNKNEQNFGGGGRGRGRGGGGRGRGRGRF